MILYRADQRVQVFDPLLQHTVAGTVVTATVGCVLVALDDRMVHTAVDPANSLAIQPLVAVA